MTTVNAMLTRTRPTTRLSVAKPPASFWYRFCALTLDLALVLGAAFSLAQLLNAVFSIGNEAVAWVTLALGGVFAILNLIFLPVFNKGQSPGKQLVGIKIVAEEDEDLTVPAMAKRQLLGYPLSSFLLLGFISSALDSEGQGWHDKIAKTRVIADPRQTSANLYPAIVSSALIHLLVGAAVLALIIILPFLFDALKIKFPDITAQEVPPPPSMEFTLTEPTKSAAKPAKQTRRASANSVAGGKRNPNRPVETGTKGAPAPRPTPTPRRAVSTPRPPEPTPVEPPTPRPAPPPRPIPKAPDAVLPKQEEPPPTPKPSPELAPLSREPEPEPAPPAPPAPKRRATRSSNVGSSSPLASAPASALGGPLSARSSGSGGNGGVGESGRFNPDRDGAGTGVDAGEDVDFGPYMSELQRKVKRRWIAPEAGNSRRTVLLFSVSKDGQISNLKVGRSSGSASSDEAAKQAVLNAAPFKRLPAAYKNDRIDIQFTFDVNVFGDVDVGGRGF